MKKIILKIYCLLSFLNVYSQNTSFSIPTLQNRLKIIKSINSPDSNTLFIEYDEYGKIQFLKEYYKNNNSWLLLNEWQYRRNKSGDVDAISCHNTNATKRPNSILLVMGEANMFFIYTGNSIERRVISPFQGVETLSYYKDKNKYLINEDTYNTNYYYVYNNDRNGRIINIYDRRPADRNAAATTNFFYDNKNSFASDLVVHAKTKYIYNPFRILQLSFENNITEMSAVNYRDSALINNYVSQQFSYNEDNYPKSALVKDITGLYSYVFLYAKHEEDFSWEAFLAGTYNRDSNVAYNNRKIDSINSVKKYLASLLRPENISPGNAVVYRTANSIRHNNTDERGKFIQIFSKNKTQFRIENCSDYPLLVKLNGFIDINLPAQYGATIKKELISDSTTINVAYSSDAYKEVKKTLLKNVAEYGGLEVAGKQVENGILNRDRSLPTIVWRDYDGKIVYTEEADPIREEALNALTDGLTKAFSGYLEEQRVKEMAKLQLAFDENEKVFAASNGIANYYSYHFNYKPIKDYINNSLKEK